jgi:translation initiation factor eIF-2B subunit gamma
MGIHDIFLVTPPESASALESALATNPILTSLPKPQPEVIAPKDLEQTTGTGELLRLPEVHNAITADFVVLPCDLVSELDGTKILQQWMTLNPPSSSRNKQRQGGMGVFYPTQGLEGISNRKDETDFLATVPLPQPTVTPPHGSLRCEVEQVVLAMPTDTLNDTIEESKGIFRVRQSLLNKHSRTKMRMKHRDSHFYVFPLWVKDFVAKNERFDSISEDVLGSWAKASWQDGLVARLGLAEVLEDQTSEIHANDRFDEDDDADPSSLSSTKATAAPVQKPSVSFASRAGEPATSPTTNTTTVPPLLAYVQPAPSPTAPQPLIRRVDTSAQVSSISLYLARQSSEHSLAHEHKIHPSASIGQQCRVSQEDSLIGENVQMGMRCNIKESVVGANCELGANVRLTKCVLMDGVHVGDGVQLTNCIIGRRARIEGQKPVGGEGEAPESAGEKKPKKKKGGEGAEDDRTKLTDCEVAPNYVVEAGTEAKGEKLMAFDTDEMDEEDDDEDEGDEDEDDD